MAECSRPEEIANRIVLFSERVAQTTVNDVELTHEEWPQGFSDGELTPDEFKRARAEAMEKAEETPYDCIAA